MKGGVRFEMVHHLLKTNNSSFSFLLVFLKFTILKLESYVQGEEILSLEFWGPVYSSRQNISGAMNRAYGMGL